MTSDQYAELKAIQDAYVEMKLSEEQVSADTKSDKGGRKIPARRLVDTNSKDYERTDESARSEKMKNIGYMLDRMYVKADANTKLQVLKQQNKDKKKLPEEVESLDELSRKGLSNYISAAKDDTKERSVGIKLAQKKKWGDSKFGTTSAKVPANEEVESLDELSTKFLDRYKEKAGEAASKADKNQDFKTADKRFRGIIQATKNQFKNDIKEESLDEAFDVHNKDAFKRAEMEYELGHEDKNNGWGHSSKKPKMLGMYFYNVPAGKEDLARASGLKQTKSGKWALTKYDTSGETFRDHKRKSDIRIGKGTWWEPKAVKEEVEPTNFMAKVIEALHNQRVNKELVEELLDEARAKKEPMEVYHTGYSAALQHAEKHLNKQGYEIHPDDWQHHISHGPAKPSEGKTNQLHIPLHKDGVKSKKVAHIQVYNRGNEIPKNNELNMYVN